MTTWPKWISEQITRIWLLAFLPSLAKSFLPSFLTVHIKGDSSPILVGVGVLFSIMLLRTRILTQKQQLF
jgi:hypothetical protein